MTAWHPPHRRCVLLALAGDSARAAAEISAEADAAGLTGTQRTGTDACVRYLTSKDEYLRSDQALTAGWSIATGVIAILTLRAVIANGDYHDYHDYHDYWHYHLAREHQRLYPGTAQGQYTCAAASCTHGSEGALGGNHPGPLRTVRAATRSGPRPLPTRSSQCERTPPGETTSHGRTPAS